jgi:hypothetical protein
MEKSNNVADYLSGSLSCPGSGFDYSTYYCERLIMAQIILSGEDYDAIIDSVIAHDKLTLENVKIAANDYTCFMYFPEIDNIISEKDNAFFWDKCNRKMVFDILAP